MKLENISLIKTGQLFKTALRNQEDGNIGVILPKNLTENGVLDTDNITKIQLGEAQQKQFLENNQIIFKAKSAKPLAAIIKDSRINMIVSHHFLVITIETEIVLPEFVCWYINQPPAQEHFSRNATGSTVSMINKRVLGELEIPSIDIKSQERIINMHNTFLKEKGLTENMLKLKEQTISQLLLTYLEGEI